MSLKVWFCAAYLVTRFWKYVTSFTFKRVVKTELNTQQARGKLLVNHYRIVGQTIILRGTQLIPGTLPT